MIVERHHTLHTRNGVELKCQRWHGDPPDVVFVEGVKA